MAPTVAASPSQVSRPPGPSVSPSVASPSSASPELAPRDPRGMKRTAATDDEILGIISAPLPDSRAPGQRALDFGEAPDAAEATAHSDAEQEQAIAADLAAGEPDHLRAAFEGNPELRAAWHDAHAYRETFPTPEAARAATALLTDLNRMDALFFSGRAEDHAELARAVADLDPAAFASLAQAMNGLATESQGHSANPAPKTAAEKPQHDAVAAEIAGPTLAQSEFFNATNASAVEGVLEAIESQVERLLPEGVSKSARNRVVGEIYRELDATLRSNRDLARQMREAFRSGSLDTDHQRAVVSLITGRARQALPGVAKRVLNEWTSTLMAANQERRARQRTAERRVDIAGAGGAANDGRRAMSPREIDYGRMSDADILNL